MNEDERVPSRLVVDGEVHVVPENCVVPNVII